MLNDFTAKIIMNKGTSKAVCAIASNTTKIATIMTNPVAATAVVATTAAVLIYKHAENSDKRKYEYAR